MNIDLSLLASSLPHQDRIHSHGAPTTITNLGTAPLPTIRRAPLDFDADPPAPDQCGLFIHPNEFNPQNFLKALENRGGVYLGVGTFRTLSAIGMGSFDHAVLLDYDHGTVLFNKANLSLLCRYANREEYISKLFHTPIDRATLAKIDRSEENAVAVLGNPIVSADELSSGRPRHIFSRSALAALRRDFSTPEQWGATIFGSDWIYSKVREMATEGRITARCGDFVNGKRALRSLASALNARGLKISAIDLSNLSAHGNPCRAFAPQWSPTSIDTGPRAERDNWIKLAWNLACLPTTLDALVLCTDQYTMPSCRPRYASWSYSSLAIDEYIEALSDPDITTAQARLKDISNDPFINITRDLETPVRRNLVPEFMRARMFT
jgi:hypothetical protein